MTMPPRMMWTRTAAAISAERAARWRPLGSMVKRSTPRAINPSRDRPSGNSTNGAKLRRCRPLKCVDAEGDEQTTGAPIAILGNQEPSDRPGLLNELPRVVYRDPEVAVRGPLQPAAPH